MIPTSSVTAVLLILVLFVLAAALEIAKLPKLLAWIVIFAGCALSGIAILVTALRVNDLMILIDRNSTLTGRTGIWLYIGSYIERRPFIGYGYKAFFADQGYVSHIKQTFLFDLTGSHNGYLEVCLDLGAVGLIILVTFLMGGLFQSLRRLAGGGDLAARFGFFWLILYFGRNMVESDLLTQSQLTWPLALLAVLFQSPAVASRVSDNVMAVRSVARSESVVRPPP